MDFSIASILTLDGVTNGAIYALLALATVLVFAVTRVIFIPQGEFVAYGALTLALLQTRQGAGHGVAAAGHGAGWRRCSTPWPGCGAACLPPRWRRGGAEVAGLPGGGAAPSPGGPRRRSCRCWCRAC